MAFALALSKFESSAEVLVAPGSVITAEGQAMVRLAGSTAAGVLPSAAVPNTTEIFVGFAIAGTSALPFPEMYASKVEAFIMPASGVLTLQLTPTNGQIFVYDNTTGAAIPASAYTVVANKITVTSPTAGDSISVTYKYALTVVQRHALYGNTQPGGYAGATINQVGLVKRGLIYITEFDNSVNWAAATAVTVAANGQVTDQSGKGAVIPAVVVALPSVDYPFLGLEFSAI